MLWEFHCSLSDQTGGNNIAVLDLSGTAFCIMLIGLFKRFLNSVHKNFELLF